MEEPRPRKNVARFRQGRKRNVRRREDEQTSHKKKMERSHLEEKEIQLLIAQSNLQPNKQAKTPTQTYKEHSFSPNRYNPSKRRKESKEDEEK